MVNGSCKQAFANLINMEQKKLVYWLGEKRMFGKIQGRAQNNKAGCKP
jgi:hypothetical protein